MQAPAPSPIPARELVLERLIDAPPSALYAAWTQPEILKKWFCPKPWYVSDAVIHLHAGGANCITMRGPNGEVFPNKGVYLEVIENQKLVFTDAFVDAWTPSDKAFMVATITFTPEGNQTRYRAVVQHWNEADRATHEQMGFHEGWGKATDQLVELVGG